MDFVAVGIAGFLGAVARFALSKIFRYGFFGIFPFGTLFINLTGCFVLGFFLTLTLQYLKITPRLRLAFGTGFLGAYTTFSTFTVDSLKLIKSNQLFLAMVYILGTSVGSVIFAWLGVSLSRLITAKKLSRNGGA
ncbi:fluoride efflux transporter CrcB [Phosphitispora sp. TUW77]|uniref:fluoride efflux transporter CrcB n=1 Tax=Phosphitispora sp. TUW77 TaxID=3152361 RepID=UPI003AB51E53